MVKQTPNPRKKVSVRRLNLKFFFQTLYFDFLWQPISLKNRKKFKEVRATATP